MSGPRIAGTPTRSISTETCGTPTSPFDGQPFRLGYLCAEPLVYRKPDGSFGALPPVQSRRDGEVSLLKAVLAAMPYSMLAALLNVLFLGVSCWLALPVVRLSKLLEKIRTKTASSTKWRASRAICACLFGCVFFRSIWTVDGIIIATLR